MFARSKVLANSSFYSVIAVTVIFMFLNAFLPLNLSITAEATKYPFKLVIGLEKTTYKIGEPVNITLTLTNIGTENVTHYYGCDLVDFKVYDENFNHVYQYGRCWGRLAVVYPLFTILPSGNHTWKKSWKQIYDGSGDTTPELWRKEVPPGTYYITSLYLGSAHNVTIETAMIRISILGA